MIPNKTALFFIPAVAVGAIGGIQTMSGLEFWDTFGFTYSMFFFVYVAAYVRIPLIPPLDSEGIRHPVPIQAARVFRLIPPPLVGAQRRWFFSSFS